MRYRAAKYFSALRGCLENATRVKNLVYGNITHRAQNEAYDGDDTNYFLHT